MKYNGTTPTYVGKNKTHKMESLILSAIRVDIFCTPDFALSIKNAIFAIN